MAKVRWSSSLGLSAFAWAIVRRQATLYPLGRWEILYFDGMIYPSAPEELMRWYNEMNQRGFYAEGDNPVHLSHDQMLDAIAYCHVPDEVLANLIDYESVVCTVDIEDALDMLVTTALHKNGPLQAWATARDPWAGGGDGHCLDAVYQIDAGCLGPSPARQLLVGLVNCLECWNVEGYWTIEEIRGSEHKMPPIAAVSRLQHVTDHVPRLTHKEVLDLASLIDEDTVVSVSLLSDGVRVGLFAGDGVVCL